MTLPDVPALELINQVDHQTVRAALALATRAPLSQPLKIGSTRRVLHEGVLDDTLSPQLVLRLGWAAGRHPAAGHSPLDLSGGGAMKANQGDQILVGVTAPDTPDRRGQVIEVLGHGADEHYLVRWQDGHESIYYPGPDARVLEDR